MFKTTASQVDFILRDGINVNCKGSLNIYARRGELQLIVERMEQAGHGLLFARMEELKRKLEQEGLFSQELKKPIPPFPDRIFLITSPTGAAVRDFIRTAKNRWSGVEIILVPTQVQGAEAVTAITKALQQAEAAAHACDIVVIARGGGSLEDLWAFNEEALVRAVAACKIPVVSAIGHETDFSLTDHAADIRAATPTAAAAIATPDARELGSNLGVLTNRAFRAVNLIISAGHNRLQVLYHRLKDPAARLIEQRQRLDEAVLRMHHGIQGIIRYNSERTVSFNNRLKLVSPERYIYTLEADIKALKARLAASMNAILACKRSSLEQTATRINTASPLSVLSRGYSLVMREDGALVRDAGKLHQGERLIIKPQQGEIVCKVLKTDAGS